MQFGDASHNRSRRRWVKVKVEGEEGPFGFSRERGRGGRPAGLHEMTFFFSLPSFFFFFFFPSFNSSFPGGFFSFLFPPLFRYFLFFFLPLAFFFFSPSLFRVNGVVVAMETAREVWKGRRRVPNLNCH